MMSYLKCGEKYMKRLAVGRSRLEDGRNIDACVKEVYSLHGMKVQLMNEHEISTIDRDIA